MHLLPVAFPNLIIIFLFGKALLIIYDTLHFSDFVVLMVYCISHQNITFMEAGAFVSHVFLFP